MHFRLCIRPHQYFPYCIEGDEESRIERFHGSARDAEQAVHTFCRENGCTASLRIYTPRNRLWSTNEIGANGQVIKARPNWLLRGQNHVS